MIVRIFGLVEALKADQLGLFGADASRGGRLRAVKRTDRTGRTQTRWVSAADGAGGKGAKILSLFSGVGGLDLGLHRALPHAETVGFCEIDPHAQKVLRRHFPGIPLHSDVNDLAKRAEWPEHERPNIVIGGFPCTDLSAAKQNAEGLEGARSGLYHKLADIVGRTNPDWVVLENVPPLRTNGLDRVVADLHAMGYDVAWDHIPASAVGAPHQRDRIFVVAHRPGVDFRFRPPERHGHWGKLGDDLGAPELTDDSPTRASAAQVKAAGNAVSPIVAEHLGKMIAESKPGTAPTGKHLGSHALGKWFTPDGEPVTTLPRAGRVQGGHLYEETPTAPTAPLHKALRTGDPVWINNPDPNDPWWGKGKSIRTRLGLRPHERDVLVDLHLEGPAPVDDYAGTKTIKRAAESLEQRGFIFRNDAGEWEATEFGDALGHALMDGDKYGGEGGANDEYPGRVVAISHPGDPNAWVIVEHGDGSTMTALPMTFVRRYPTPTATDWKGGWARRPKRDDDEAALHPSDEDRSHIADPLREKRERGAQLRHWVNGGVNPRFPEWTMGFPHGWLEAAPEDGDDATPLRVRVKVPKTPTDAQPSLGV